MASDQATESFSNSRRNFIKMAAARSAVASALSAASATIAQEAAVRLPENEPGPYDLVIAGGRCVIQKRVLMRYATWALRRSHRGNLGSLPLPTRNPSFPCEMRFCREQDAAGY